MKKLLNGLKNFFLPSTSKPVFVRLLPYAVLGVLTILVLVWVPWGWEYTNSPAFCGTVCHTMPPQYSTYLVSPHAHVTCVDCHLGRDSLPEQIVRKAGEYRILFAMLTHSYDYPIRAHRMIPANQACEKCHNPDKFTDDSLKPVVHFLPDQNNSKITTYLVLKTGGGSSRDGLGYGIHWHTENPVYFYASDAENQDIPYVRVTRADGSVTEYVDAETNFSPQSIKPEQLQRIDCITCHNRTSHQIEIPESAVDQDLERGIYSTKIPEIRKKAVEVLRGKYSTSDQALAGIASLNVYYQDKYPDFYKANRKMVETAVAHLQETYVNSVFPEQGFTWDSHPNNIGHENSAGCFRCHDGKHLNAQGESIRLECNLCHSIPVVVAQEQAIAQIEVSRGTEPGSHLNANWILLHKDAFNPTCSSCHTIADPGGTSNTSFCSNSGCHGNSWKYAGFDAPKVRKVLIEQLKLVAPTPQPEILVPEGSQATFKLVETILQAKCTGCHGENGRSGLDLRTYAASVKGGKSGAGIVPGSPDQSQIIIKQSGPNPHFGQFTPQELQIISNWIQAGAPEN
jgi:nitrate/TMAO reductase-like tetraheme cytochrome c subunit